MRIDGLTAPAALLSFIVLAPGCREKGPSSAAPATSAARPSFQRATTRVDVADADLNAYLEWLRDWKSITNRHRAELDEVTERALARLPVFDPDKAVQDPEFLAMLAEQRKDGQALSSRMPKGPTAEALATMVGGVESMTVGPGAVGTMVPQPNGVVYRPGRNEKVLAEARAKYGDTFVDWVLARESLIVETLGGW